MKLLFGVALFFHVYILKKENLIKIIFNKLACFRLDGAMLIHQGRP